MAEEVKIVDVAGGPAAEATLQELLKVMKGGAGGGSSGGSSDAAAKATGLYTDSVTRGTKSQAKNTKGLDKSTTALEKMASAVGGIVTGTFGLLKNVLGGVIGISVNLIKAFGDGTGTLTDMVSAIPGIGSILGMFTGYLDNTLTVFQQLSSSGASFNNNLTELRLSAAASRVSLESFAGLIGSNSENLAMFGGTVTQGAKAFVDTRRAMNKYETDLLNMGYTFEEINEGLMDYMALNAAGSRAGQRDQAQQAQAAASYATSLTTLSKLTGQDIKAIKERQAAATTDLAFQMKLSKMSAAEKEKVLAGMLEAEAAGPAAVARFKEEVMGFPPMTRETQLFAATLGAANQAIIDRVAATRNETLSAKEFTDGSAANQARMVAGMLESAASMETVLTAGSLSGEGIGNELLNILQNSGVNLNKYIGMSGQALQDEIEKDIIAAQEENRKRDDAVKGLLAFQQTLKDIKEQFETNIVAPITKAVGPQLKLLGEAFGNANSTTLTPFIEKIGSAIETITTDINKFGVAGALDSLITRIGVAAKPVFTGMMDTLSRFIFGETKTDMEARLNETKASLEGQSAEIQKQIDALNTNLPNLEGAAAEAATKQIQGLEQQLANVGRQIGETQVEIDGAEDSSGLFGDTFSTIWESISGMDWKTVAISLGVLGAAIVALGFVAKPVVLPLIAIGAAAAGIGLGASGIAALIDSITGSVGKLADGLAKFENLDSGKLLDVGTSLGPLTTGIMDLAKGGIVASFVSEGALEGLAAGIKSFEGLDAATLTPIGAAIQGLGDPIKEIASAGFFANFVSDGALEGLAKGVKSFEGLDVKGLTATGPALAALQQGIAAFTGDGVLDSVSKGVGGFISSLFGGEEGQFDALIEGLKKFEEVNADAIHKVGTGLQGLSEFATSDVDLGQINFSADGLERLNDITKTLDAGAITKYNEALEKLVEVLGELNTELSGANVPGATGGGATSGPSPAANALGNVSGSNSNSATERLNMLVSQLVALQTENNRIGGKTVKALGGNMQA